jgi:hypothetical protein
MYKTIIVGVKKIKSIEMDSIKINSRLEKLRSNLEHNEDGGFKFVITLIVAIVSVMFYIYNSAQNNQILFLSATYYIILVFIFLSATLFFYIISYIFLKATALETKNRDNKNQLLDAAANYYIDIFKVAFLLITWSILAEIWTNSIGSIFYA